MVTLPAFFIVSTPSADTAAVRALFDLYVTSAIGLSASNTSCTFSPTPYLSRPSAVESVSCVGAGFTVTWQSAVFPLYVSTVTVPSPALSAVTLPEASTEMQSPAAE